MVFLIAAAIPVILVGVPAYAVLSRGNQARYWQRLYSRAQHAAEDVGTSAGHADPMVEIVFETYSGFLSFAEHRTHRMRLPTHHARALLRGLHRHNLTWGLLAHGMLLTPFLSLANYRSECRKIDLAEQLESERIHAGTADSGPS